LPTLPPFGLLERMQSAESFMPCVLIDRKREERETKTARSAKALMLGNMGLMF
jgi:hypothetical protein